MIDDIDFKKISEQEPEFAEFAKDAMYLAFLATQIDFIKAMYSFYAIGMTSKQVSDWLITNMRLNKS